MFLFVAALWDEAPERNLAMLASFDLTLRKQMPRLCAVHAF